MECPNKVKPLQAAEIQLSYKSQVKPSQRPKVGSSRDAYEVFKANWDESQVEFVEQFKVLLLNRAHRVLGIYEVSSGSPVGTVVDPKMVFCAAIKANACSIIVAHNHPSGNLSASQSDLDLTRKLRDGAKLLEIQLLDHVIITSEKYYSFADDGIL